MDFAPSPKARDYAARVSAFLEAHVLPVEEAYFKALQRGPGPWTVPPVMAALKARYGAALDMAKAGAAVKARLSA